MKSLKGLTNIQILH